MRCVIGVDLGGTNVRAQAFFEDGSPAGERFEGSSRATQGKDATIEAVVGIINQAIKTSSEKADCIGMAVPGHIDDAHGVVRWAPNFGIEQSGVFHSWKDVHLADPIKDATGLSVKMGNDANLAALGEYRYGLGANKASCFVMLTLGTGIGGGVILGPEALSGSSHGRPVMLVGADRGGAELGHTVIQQGGLDSKAGIYGSLEAYCQRDAIVQRALYKLSHGHRSVLTDLVDGDYSRLTPQTLTIACEQGDEVAIQVYREVGTYLGTGIGNFINIFAPDIVAIGGQISKAGEFLLEPARREARNVAIPSLFRDVAILAAEQPEDAGLLGAVALALL